MTLDDEPSFCETCLEKKCYCEWPCEKYFLWKCEKLKDGEK